MKSFKAAPFLVVLLISIGCSSTNVGIRKPGSEVDSTVGVLPPGVSFSVVSVRAMLSEEAIRRTPPDVIGWDVAVRLRLETGDSAIHVLCDGDEHLVAAAPLGHRVELTHGKPQWMFWTDQVTTRSPGIPMHNPAPWVVLGPRSSLEWEVFDSFVCEQSNPRAQTVFLKEPFASDVSEVFSKPYEPLMAPDGCLEASQTSENKLIFLPNEIVSGGPRPARARVASPDRQSLGHPPNA